jgi:hypothetical protein
MIAALCVAFSPSLHAAVRVETFTDYSAFLSLLGQSAQVVNFDDVPTTNGFGYFDSNRYANQGILIRSASSAQAVEPLGSLAVSPPNVYLSALSGGPTTPPEFRETSYLTFTQDGQPARTSAFGTFFVNNIGTPGLGVMGRFFWLSVVAPELPTRSLKGVREGAPLCLWKQGPPAWRVPNAGASGSASRVGGWPGQTSGLPARPTPEARSGLM